VRKQRRNWTADEINRLRRLATSQRMSTYDLATSLSRDPETVRKAMVKYHIPRLNRGRAMELNYFWKGGTKIDKRGYILVKCPGHPFLTSCGYIREHRLVMEMVIGRYLQPQEVVGHNDGNPQNNDPDNLTLYPSNGEHLKADLTGKIPNWTPEGRARILRAIHRQHGPNPKLQAIAKARPPRARNKLGQFLPVNND